MLSHAQPVTEVGAFNGRRFFRGTIAGKSVVLGLTGIGLVDAEATASAVLDSIEVDGIIFSGVAGGDHHIGDVIVPDHWTEGANSYPVHAGWYATARARAGNVALDPCLPVEDATCTGQRLPERTPVCIADAPGQTGPQVYFGGRGNSADPFGGRAVPCLSGAGSLEGCEACGAPPNTSPGIVPFVSDAAPFADPFFLIDLFQSFAPGGGGGRAGRRRQAHPLPRLPRPLRFRRRRPRRRPADAPRFPGHVLRLRAARGRQCRGRGDRLPLASLRSPLSSDARERDTLGTHPTGCPPRAAAPSDRRRGCGWRAPTSRPAASRRRAPDPAAR